jgi:imidazolonepropionase-like amidohydrolase
LPVVVFAAAASFEASAQVENAYPSTYAPPAAPATAIVGATILTAAGPRIENGTIILSDGKVSEVGRGLPIPDGATVIDGTGKWVTPGIIDLHSHLGVFSSPGVPSMRNGNEKTGKNTAEVWAEHSIWPQDPGFETARAGGVTTLAVLPGSANLFGGRSVTVKNVPSVTVQGMKFPGAPYGAKMACGENPIFYAARGNDPFTRMGNMAGFRSAFIDAQAYAEKMKKGVEPGQRNLKNETLAGILNGEIAAHIHCYRADEMAQMIDLSKEFGFKIAAFHHASEAYKIADLLAAENIGAATWGDHWGFKLEAYDGVSANVGALEAAGANAIVHSDSSSLVQRLNVEAAIALAAARRTGLNISREDAIRWITANPAKTLGIIERTGTLEAGKMADVVLWSGDPFSIYSLAEKVFIDGAPVFERSDEDREEASDFLLGQPTREQL